MSTLLFILAICLVLVVSVRLLCGEARRFTPDERDTPDMTYAEREAMRREAMGMGMESRPPEGGTMIEEARARDEAYQLFNNSSEVP